MAKHTPGTWRTQVSKITQNTLIKAGDAPDDSIVTVCEAHHSDADTAAANAARIVAAVNATAGMDDAALALLPVLLSSYANAVEARDRLLAAAKEALPALKDRLCHHQFDTVGNLAVDGLVAAIAFTEKGTDQ